MLIQRRDLRLVIDLARSRRQLCFFCWSAFEIIISAFLVARLQQRSAQDSTQDHQDFINVDLLTSFLAQRDS